MRYQDQFKADAERFASDTKDHALTVLHDDGLYRHLRFRSPRGGMYWFDLVTWPGYLSFTGDGDGFTFTRVEDMFTFFRRQGINPGHWSEKVVAGREGLRAFSEKKARELIEEAVREANRQGLLKDVREEILESDALFSSDTARAALRDYEWIHPDDRAAVERAERAWSEAVGSGAPRTESDALWTAYRREKDRLTFTFDYAGEWDFHEWDWWFLWACHAIVWGIAQYDAAKLAGGAAPAGDSA